MMMRVMIMGGIEGVYDNKVGPFPATNNPYGVFELRGQTKNPEELEGKVIKLMGRGIERIPEEYHLKIIRINRDTIEIAKSRYRRRVRRIEMGKRANLTRTLDMAIEHINDMKSQFEETYSKRKNTSRIDINFNDMLSDTENQVKRIAEFVECPFDIDNAIKAVDKTLNHGEGFDYGRFGNNTSNDLQTNSI